MQIPGVARCWQGRDRGAEAVPGKVPAAEVVDISMTMNYRVSLKRYQFDEVVCGFVSHNPSSNVRPGFGSARLWSDGFPQKARKGVLKLGQQIARGFLQLNVSIFRGIHDCYKGVPRGYVPGGGPTPASGPSVLLGTVMINVRRTVR